MRARCGASVRPDPERQRDTGRVDASTRTRSAARLRSPQLVVTAEVGPAGNTPASAFSAGRCRSGTPRPRHPIDDARTLSGRTAGDSCSASVTRCAATCLDSLRADEALGALRWSLGWSMAIGTKSPCAQPRGRGLGPRLRRLLLLKRHGRALPPTATVAVARAGLSLRLGRPLPAIEQAQHRRPSAPQALRWAVEPARVVVWHVWTLLVMG